MPSAEFELYHHQAVGGRGGFSNREGSAMTGLEPQDRKPTSCREAHQERRKDTSWRSLAEHSLGRGRSGNRSTARGSHLRSKKVRMTPTSVWPRWLHTGERAGVQASGKRCLSVPSLRIPHGCAQDVGGGCGGGAGAWSAPALSTRAEQNSRLMSSDLITSPSVGDQR